ncbi:PAS domain S-box protein [Salibacterium sp. K-3]
MFYYSDINAHHNYLQLALHHISDMVFLIHRDENGRFRYSTANHTAVEMLYFPDNFQGKEISEIMPDSSTRIIQKKYQEAVERQQTITYQSRIEVSSGGSGESPCALDVESKVTPIINECGRCDYLIAVTRDVTSWVEQNKQFKQALQKMELMFNHAADAVFMFDKDARYTKVNQGFTNIFGWTEEELLRDSSISILPEEYPGFKSIWHQLQEGHVVENHYDRRIAKSGCVINVLASYSPVMDDGKMVGGVAMYKDITELKQVEDRLRESEEKYRAIVNHTNDLIRVLDAEGFVQYASPSHKDVLGLPSDFFVGKSILSFTHPDDMDKLQNTINEILETGRSADIEYRRYHKDGAVIWIEARCTPVLNHNRIVQQIVLVARDVSNRKGREEKLRSMAMYDELTRLPNRRFFYQELEQAVKVAERYKNRPALLTLDCDNFKAINDKHGHVIGDKVIKSFAGRVQQCLRDDDLFSRVGGDEFHILLPNAEKKADVTMIARRILQALEEPLPIDDDLLNLTASIGAAFYKKENSVEQWIRESDKALYKAKTTGKNSFIFY